MACITDLPELNIIDPDEWPFSPLIPGFIPVIWTGGAYNPLLQDSSPWMGLVVPDRLEWMGATLEITFFSGKSTLNGCYTTYPKTVVRISFHCTGGFHQFHVEVNAGNRRFERNLWNVPGSWQLYNDNLEFDGTEGYCVKHYFQLGKLLEMDLRVLIDWIQLMRDFTVSSSGNPPEWYNYVLDHFEDELGLQSVCSGCWYGSLPMFDALETESLENILSTVDPLPGFPISSNDFGAIISCNGKSAIIANGADYSYTVYRELKVWCGTPVTISGTGNLNIDCVFDPNELPRDDDPRWAPEESLITCSHETREVPPTDFGSYLLLEEGWYNGHPSASAIPRQQQYTLEVISYFPNGASKVTWYVRTVQTIERYTKVTPGKPTERWTIVRTVGRWDYITNADQTNEERAAEMAAINNTFNNQWYPAYLAFRNNPACGGMLNFSPVSLPSTPPEITKPREERLNLDGKCYVKGEVTIGIKFNVEFVRIFRKLGPEVQEWAVRKLIGRFIPTSIKIPFKFQLPQGTTQINGTSVTITGTFIQVGIGPESMVINIEEVFAYYNLLDDTSLIGLLIPGPVGISNLESFCIP